MANHRSGFVFVAVALTLATLAGAGNLPGQTISFIARRDFGVGSNPFSVAVGDFNGDGVQDLAVANISSTNVNQGRGLQTPAGASRGGHLPRQTNDSQQQAGQEVPADGSSGSCHGISTTAAEISRAILSHSRQLAARRALTQGLCARGAGLSRSGFRFSENGTQGTAVL